MNDLDALNEFLDGDAPESADLGGIDKRELAAHLVVAGVTRQLLHEPAPGTATIHATMEVILAGEHRRRRLRLVTRAVAAFAAAAAVVVTAIVLLQRSPSFDAVADRIRAFAVDDLDREYQITIQSQDAFAAMLTEGMSFRLFARGADRFASRMELDLFGQARLAIWMGSDGEEFWLVPPEMPFLPAGEQPPVFVSSESLQTKWQAGDLGMFERFAQGFVRTESAGRLFSILADLRTRYGIDATPPDAAALPLQGNEIDITATRRPQADITLPDSIRMIVDEKSGVVRIALLRFMELPDGFGQGPPFRHIRYDLVSEAVTSGELYEHEAHHGPDREVVYR